MGAMDPLHGGVGSTFCERSTRDGGAIESFLSAINPMIWKRRSRTMGYWDRLSEAPYLDPGGRRTAIPVRTGSPDPSLRTIVRGRRTSFPFGGERSCSTASVTLRQERGAGRRHDHARAREGEEPDGVTTIGQSNQSDTKGVCQVRSQLLQLRPAAASSRRTPMTADVLAWHRSGRARRRAQRARLADLRAAPPRRASRRRVKSQWSFNYPH
jgi:hypothetical protein